MLGGHGLADLYTGMPSEVEAILPGNSHTSYNSTQLKIFIGMSTKLIANGHVQIYKYTEYGQ